jgi:multiple sugar transport system substrate-binding protein
MSRNEDHPLPTAGEIHEPVPRADRRGLLKSGAGAAAIVGAGGLGMAQPAAAQWTNVPERGARLRVLRWKRFVQGDEDMWAANTRKFSEKYDIEVRIDAEGWEDVRPKAAVAANVGSGPDIIISTFEDAHQYPDKLVDVSDVCNYLGKKYGGWYPVAEAYGRHADRGRKGNWVAVPMGAAGNCLVYRDSHVKAAGFDAIPKDLPGFLKLCQAMKAKGTPPGFALGNATGDANTWCHWLLWAHGGKVVDDKNNVVLNSPETVAALEYAKQLYATFVPGTLSWLDPNNNKAFLDGQCSMVFNGISVYYAAKTSTDPKLKEMVSDIQHANMPVGVTGKPTELNLFFPMMVFRYTKFPRAAKEYLRFMMEQEQYLPWQEASIGYVTQPLRAYESNPIWTVDPKHTPYRDAMKVMLPNGFDGEMGYSSAAVMADFVVVNMIAEAASGQRSAKEAAERAQQRALRYYKV